jgi:hypothetical protein
MNIDYMNKLYNRVIAAYNKAPRSIKLTRRSFKPAAAKQTPPVMAQILELGITDDINEVYNLIDDRKLPPHIQKQIQDTTLYSIFTPTAVQHDIEQNAYHIYEYKNNRCSLKIYAAAVEVVAEVAAETVSRISTMQTLYGNNTHYVDITIYLTDNKKIINPEDRMLGTNEINSGVSIFQSDKIPKINIFRAEEMNKLIIHEMVHCLNLDDRHITVDFSKLFNVMPQTDYKVYEAYTEFMAVVINTMITHDKDTWQTAFAVEQRFALFQIAKILIHYGFANMAEFNRPYCCDKFQQETAVFSYFFIKAALLFRAEEFLALKKQSRNSYIEFTKNPQFLEHVDAYMTYITANRQRIPTDLWNTLRMTINE